MRFNFAPGSDAAGINGLPDLFAARGADGTLRGMKVEASGFKWHADMFEQTADLSFRVAHHRFVLDTVDATLQHVVPMIHEPEIVGEIGADMFELVTEIDPSREMLLEQTEPAIERIAPGVDDDGMR